MNANEREWFLLHCGSGSPWTYSDRGRSRHLTGKFAVFTLQNRSRKRIGYMVETVEVRAPSGWATNQILRQTPTNWVFRHDILCRGAEDFPRAACLHKRDVENSTDLL
jgi:hypothetical protein